jgi:hypothetical protein
MSPHEHSFAEMLRFEIRQDLEQVPDDQRPLIVRDIYRHLLGYETSEGFRLDTADGRAVYSIDEALGDIQLYRLWRVANRCFEACCRTMPAPCPTTSKPTAGGF